MIILRGGRIVILRQDTLGVSGGRMIEAIIVGEGDPERFRRSRPAAAAREDSGIAIGSCR